jgi:hypothetical protein
MARRFVLGSALVAAGALIAGSARDIRRYLRMSRM